MEGSVQGVVQGSVHELMHELMQGDYLLQLQFLLLQNLDHRGIRGRPVQLVTKLAFKAFMLRLEGIDMRGFHKRSPVLGLPPYERSCADSLRCTQPRNCHQTIIILSRQLRLATYRL